MSDPLSPEERAAVQFNDVLFRTCPHTAKTTLDVTYAWRCPCGWLRIHLGDVPYTYGENDVMWGDPGYEWGHRRRTT